MKAASRHEASRRHDEGLALWRRSDFDRALEKIGEAVDLAPETALFRTSFGVVLASLGESAAAAASWRTALALDPAEPLALVNLANAAQAEEADRAHDLYARALACDPANAAAHGNLGTLEEKRGGTDAARRLYERALALDPALARLWANLGSLRHGAGAPGAAEIAFGRALALAPGLPGARFDRGVVRLLKGDYVHGLADYEARWLKPGTLKARIDTPAWEGEDLRGKHLLLWAEQGQGDAIQFLRFVPRLSGLGATVSLLVSRRLIPLVRGFPGIAHLHAIEEAAPRADLSAPLMSLPFRLGLGPATPAPVPPYLAAAPARLAKDGRPLIGLVWAGNPANETDAKRSLDLAMLAPMLKRADLRFVSLQFGPRAGDVERAGLSDRIGTIALGDFHETASVVMALDLVITVDTAMAHLAGALGKEAWVMLAHVPDWRWGMQGGTTSWYPSLRLFRQPGPGDWGSVVRNLSNALDERFPPR